MGGGPVGGGRGGSGQGPAGHVRKGVGIIWKGLLQGPCGFCSRDRSSTGVAYVAPSVTPYHDLNPGYRVYTVDGVYPNSTFVSNPPDHRSIVTKPRFKSSPFVAIGDAPASHVHLRHAST